MPTFEKRTRIHASPTRVFDFHARPDALSLLVPPWERMRVVEKTPGLEVGTRAVVEMKIGPFTRRVEATHTRYEAGRMFQDRQVRGPFASWEHTHEVEPDGEGGAWLVDRVAYELPLGALGELAAGWMVRRRLERMFAYRHAITRKICEEG
jgi:ligand-binding SRPBCC domain-containing protein